MKRTFAVVALLAALGVLMKLAVKEGRGPVEGRLPPGPASTISRRMAGSRDAGPTVATILVRTCPNGSIREIGTMAPRR